MLLYLLTIGLSQASEDSKHSINVRVEHLPLPENINGLSSTLNRWTPWIVYSNSDWMIKGSLLANFQSQQSKTSETAEQTLLSQTHLGIEAERIVSLHNVDWTVGFGLHNNFPIVRQYSSQFTEPEQEDVDAQTQSQQADLSFTRVRIPCTVQIPIQKHLQVGLGFQVSYTIQRSQSDFTTYLNTALYSSPLLTLQTR